jgi:hypothetical protein
MRTRIWAAVVIGGILAGAAMADEAPAPGATATLIYERASSLVGQKFELNFKPKATQWIRAYDGCKKQLFFKQMAYGQQNEATFSIPADKWIWLESEVDWFYGYQNSTCRVWAGFTPKPGHSYRVRPLDNDKLTCSLRVYDDATNTRPDNLEYSQYVC